jgi:hypothetical protein
METSNGGELEDRRVDMMVRMVSDGGVGSYVRVNIGSVCDVKGVLTTTWGPRDSIAAIALEGQCLR